MLAPVSQDGPLLLREDHAGVARLTLNRPAARNALSVALMAALADALPGVHVESSAGHGLDPDCVEAMAFAWLARETLAGRPGNLPAVTGAAGPRVLGAIYPS